MKTYPTRRPVAAALSGFEHIARMWDSHHNIWLAKIQPGEACVTASNEGVTTVLGSCVSACVRDIRTGIGGMNHFMLPDDDERHGTEVMEHLVNAVLSHGCGERSRLELKLVGGSLLKQGSQDVGRRTVEFAHRFAATLRLAVAAADVGGPQGREVLYWPGTGQLRIRKLRGIEALVAERERDYRLSIQGPGLATSTSE